MTNEERIEERLIHAHERGYYHKVMERVKYIFKITPKADHYKVYEEVCEEYKQEWLKETNDGITEHTSN
jgi:hypothetical protein